MTSVLVAPDDAQQRSSRWRSVDLERRRLSEAATQRIRSQFRSEAKRVEAHLRIAPGDIDGVLDLISEAEWDRTLLTLWTANAGLYWTRTLNELAPKKAVKAHDRDPESSDGTALALLAGVAITQVAEAMTEISQVVRERTSQIVESTRRRIATAAQRAAVGVTEGLDRLVRAEISSLYSTWDVGRSAAIARHNVVAATALGQHAAASFSGAVLGREWISMSDDRVRPTHASANGQRTTLNEPYLVGGSSLRYPGDPAGPPAETANCRCIEVYICFLHKSVKAMTTSGDCEGFDVEDSAGHETVVNTWGEAVEASKKWKPADTEILKKWTNGRAYRSIRKAQMQGQSSGTPGAKLAKRFTEALKGAPRYEGTVYRGFSLNRKEGSLLLDRLEKAGAEYTMEAVSSFSTSKKVGTTFASLGSSATDIPILFHVRSKTGQALGRFATASEREVIVAQGTRMRVTKVSPKPRKVVLGRNQHSWVFDVFMDEI